MNIRSVRFETEVLDQPNFQGNAAVNYTDRETPWTRIIEHKWFEFGKDASGNDLPKTVISREYSVLNGSRETSRIIRSMMRKTVSCIINIKNLQPERKM